MSNTMKWIIRILASLAVIFFVVTVGYLVFSYLNGSWISGARVIHIWEGERGIPRLIIPWDRVPLRPDRGIFVGRLRGFFPFGGFTGILFSLGFLILIAMGVVALVLSSTRSRKAVTVVPSEVPSTQSTSQAEIPTPTLACPNCQRPVDENWNHCPYCGTALTPMEE